ncbi:MAG: fdrA domain protein [Lachnospiraceae bacterium]|jgi:FdrA protein|nr:fdrA domain protein [Lachnospiraceae bacterium]MBQ4301070.1 fdrA domain protein [Lachnospiraceae bacterium]
MANTSKIQELFNSELIVLNVGPKSFSTALEDQGYKTVQVNWKPIAGGDAEMQKLLGILGY